MRYRAHALGLTLLLVLAIASPAAAQEWTFIRGDFNGDDSVGLADAVALLNFLFASGTPPTCEDAADTSDNGTLALADAVYLLNFLFVSGSPPPPPFPECGEDPTPDALDCAGQVSGCPLSADPPHFTSVPFTVGNVESPYDYDVDAEDPEGRSITYVLQLSPLGSSMDPVTGLIQWTPTLAQTGLHPFVVRATSESGLFAEQAFTVEIQAWPGAPSVEPLNSPTADMTVVVSGTATAATEIEITGGVDIVITPVAGAAFLAAVEIVANSTSVLTVRAFNAVGQASAPVVVTVVQDQQPPDVFIDFPAGGPTTADTVLVGGRVGDMLSGFLGMTVVVNGVPAEVEPGIGTNGTFVTTSPVPIVLGDNIIVVEASDALGNTRTVQTSVVRVPVDLDAPQIEAIVGGSQSATAGTDLATPIVVQVADADGSPFANKLVTFRVTRSDGRLRGISDPPGSGSLLYQVFTDGVGQAQARWTVGTDAGCGNNRVEAVTGGTQTRATFCASATEGSPIQLNVGTGNTQRGEVGAPARAPLVAWVSDSCNGVSGVPVTFTVVQGNGLVEGQSSVTVSSGLDGHAEVSFKLGSEPGVNLVEATTDLQQGRPATYVITGIVRDEAEPTSFVGRVLSNAGEPIAGATCILAVGANPALVALTGINGEFEFEDVVGAGASDLLVHGVSAYAVGGVPVPDGTFPSLHFEPNLVPNGRNQPVEPILMPRLDSANATVYSTTQDTVLTTDGIAGLRMVIAAGSMRYPSGDLAPDGAVVSLNIVHHDDIPMVMPDGAAPPFAWTLQPGGATFDPPIRVEYPNMSALPAGAVAYFLTFNHATGKFEIFSSATVTPDGSTVVSDPGDGLSVAGWGCSCPPYSATGDCKKCRKECTDGGFLSGGDLSVNTATPEFGEVLVFSASGIVDSGGELEKVCEEEDPEVMDIPPGEIVYRYVLTPPSGGSMSGMGSEAVIEAEQCGMYTATFFARADRDCAPPEVMVGSITAAVKGETPEEPMPLSTFTPTLSSLSGVLSVLQGISGLPGSPCGFTAPDLNIPVGREEFEQCCEDGSTQMFERWNGAAIESFGFSCSFPVIGVPFVISVNVNFGLDGVVYINVSGQQMCDDSQICGEWSVTVNGSAGLSIEVGPAGILGSAAADVVFLGGGEGTVCFEDMDAAPEYTGQFCVGSVSLVGTVTLLSFEIASISTTIWSGDCASP